ncbi:RmlC-like cupin [Obba rivulosa]|uniref:RmlC-like cupin n=1 Tax=Obba rivulosa TaxID=1052685 RepID=A0A8E2DQW3_9APHY|nr:RmlC-like cupin [Obba rivulosa]
MLSSLFLATALGAVGSYAQAAASAAAAAAAAEASTVAALRDAPTAVNRLNTLSQDSDFVFDFLNATTGVVTGAAGHLVSATVSNFPAVVGNGMAMTIGFLGPCGMNTPHTHPRATEMLYVVNGSIISGTLQENGARFVFNEVPGGSATIFPKGSIHFQQNNGCEPITFVAALNNEDPGVDSIAQRFLGLPPDIVSATLGDIGVEEVFGLANMIPDNIAFGTDECLQRCGIQRPTQPTNELQPRVSANAFPSSLTASSASATNSKRSLMIDSTEELVGSISRSPVSTQQPVSVALVAVISVLALGYIVMGAIFLMNKRRLSEREAAMYVRQDMKGRSLVLSMEEDVAHFTQ